MSLPDSTNEDIDQEAQIFTNDLLKPIPISNLSEVALEPTSQPVLVRRNAPKVDLQVLSCFPVSTLRDPDCDMTEPAGGPESDEAAAHSETGRSMADGTSVTMPIKPLPSRDDADLCETAALAFEKSQSAERVDSKSNSSESVPQLPPEKRRELSVQTEPRHLTDSLATPVGESLTSSPTLQKHMIHEGPKDTNLPAVQPTSPIGDGSATTPRKASGPLPPIREMVQLASAAEQRHQQESRSTSSAHQHKPSYGSTASQSPRLPYHPVFTGSQLSPVSIVPHSATTRSPASTTAESSYYGSPHAHQASHVYFPDRRLSAATESPQAWIPKVPSLPSGSSSESHGNASSSTDGINTAQTTPIDISAMPDGSSRPILPPPAAMIANAGGIFKCDFDGCSAQPFQTQYLLSSHRNVHSSSRPHYCPVPDCPRSEGGKGFKRKNEMIRHGLVHNSPGYVCPFCPDRDHKYPRPDNLQRHVRVHHGDKDKDDPALREVLGQRPEGTTPKQRRRRAQSMTTAPEPTTGAS